MNINQTSNNIDIEDFEASIEPVFYCGTKKSICVPDYWQSNRVFDFFEYRLKKNPRDLSCHLQRIQITLLKKNNDTVFAAICDLFITLGCQGIALRKRVLTGCKRVLNQEQIKILSQNIINNSITATQAFLPDNCLFKEAPFKLVQLHILTSNHAQTYEDVLLTADSYIENSQFDTAIEYISHHLDSDSNDKELTVRLIELYIKLGYADKFQKAFDKFCSRSMQSQHWHDAKKIIMQSRKSDKP